MEDVKLTIICSIREAYLKQNLEAIYNSDSTFDAIVFLVMHFFFFFYSYLMVFINVIAIQLESRFLQHSFAAKKVATYELFYALILDWIFV